MVGIYFLFMSLCLFLNYISKRKIENYLWIVAIIITWFLCVFVNPDYVDWGSYQTLFKNSDTFQKALSINKDVGFATLLFLINKLGLTAIYMRLFIFTIGFWLTHISLNKLSVNKLLFLTLYAIFPLTSDVMHLRTYIVSFLLLYATSSYIKTNNIKKFIIILLIATLFHKMAAFYLPMMFINKITDKSKFMKRFIITVSILVIVVGSNRNLLKTITNELISISSSVDLGNYTNTYGAGINNGWIVDWTCQLLCTALILLIWKNRNRTNIPIDNKMINIILWINIYAIVFLPFYLVSFDYFRLYRSILPINYMYFCLYIQSYGYEKYRNSISIKKIISLAMVIVFVISLGFVKVTYRGRADEEFYNFFNNEKIIPYYKYNQGY